MKVLITGASGFVGSWLLKRLLAEGYDVHVLRRRSSTESISKNEIEFSGDILDLDSLKRAMSGCEFVFHLAGHVGYSKRDRQIMEEVNVKGTANIIDSCKTSGVKKLIHMSSVVAIGASFSPDHILNEESLYLISHLNLGYFETKKAAEDLVVSATRRGEIQSVILNPSTIYGPGDAAKGSRKVQLKVARGQFRFYTSGGVSIISIEDVVDAIIVAMTKGKNGERYILSGENIKIKTLFETIARHAGVNAPSIYLPNPVIKAIGCIGDQLEKLDLKGPINTENAWTSILYHWFDNSKAKRELGLNPKSADVAIGQSVEWMKERGLLL